MSRPHAKPKLPVVLSLDEAARLLANLSGIQRISEQARLPDTEEAPA
jgi:hypothetical protein